MGWMSPTSSHQVHKESDCVYQAAQDVPHDSEIEKRGIFQLRGSYLKTKKQKELPLTRFEFLSFQLFLKAIDQGVGKTLFLTEPMEKENIAPISHQFATISLYYARN